MIMTDLLWSLYYILDDTDITCTTLHLFGITRTTLYLSLDIDTVYIVSWSWYTLYSLSSTDILDTDSWSYYPKSHTISHLYWLIKLTMSGLLGETGSRRNQEGALGRATLCGFGCHTCSCVLEIYLCTCYYMLHDILVQWTVSPYYQDQLTHHLFDMQLSCEMRHMIVALV